MENNARIKCSGYIPIRNAVQLNNSSLWKGKRVLEPGSPEDYFVEVIFSRDYNEEENDFDKIFKEHNMDETLLGFSFIMVPKDKVVAFYDPPSMIAKPDIKLSRYNMDI
jgi:hypothetical protein